MYACVYIYIYIYIYICVCVCVCVSVCFQLDVFIREHVWHKVWLMGYSMRFELTLCWKFEWFLLPYLFFFSNECWSFFLEYLSLSLFYP